MQKVLLNVFITYSLSIGKMLDLISFTSIIIIFLSIFQTIIGVGILVLGTPILLLIGFEMVEVMMILLPLSIINSLINILYLKYSYKKIKVDNLLSNYFFLICFPGVFFGLFFLKLFNEFINFNLLVGLVIWIVLLLSYLHKNKDNKFLDKFKKGLIFLTGFVHGITNSGGTLLSILVIETYKKKVNYIRYQIIYFYLILALFQYLSIIFIFDYNFLIKINLDYLYCLVAGIIFGNLFSKTIKKNQLRNIIFILAFLSSLFLLFQS